MLNEALLYTIGQVFLPEYKYCTLRFMKSLFSGEKKFYQNFEVNISRVPVYRELKVKSVLKLVKSQPAIMAYLPDVQELKTNQIDRRYLFTVLNT